MGKVIEISDKTEEERIDRLNNICREHYPKGDWRVINEIIIGLYREHKEYPFKELEELTIREVGRQLADYRRCIPITDQNKAKVIKFRKKN